jgi:hypothetical protein
LGPIWYSMIGLERSVGFLTLSLFMRPMRCLLSRQKPPINTSSFRVEYTGLNQKSKLPPEFLLKHLSPGFEHEFNFFKLCFMRLILFGICFL